MHIRSLLLLFPTLLLLAACGQPEAGQQAQAAADKFAAAYFNYDFPTALTLCTPESQKWLRFAASNVYEADLEVLRSMDEGAEVEPSEVESLGDTVATVSVAVSHYMQRDTIGRPGHVTEGQTYHLRLVKRSGQWLVSLDGIPRVRE